MSVNQIQIFLRQKISGTKQIIFLHKGMTGEWLRATQNRRKFLSILGEQRR